MHTCDVCIIGGGIIGLSIARTLKKHHPDISITILEKEHDIATHASGRNSGVLHAGFYYSANSLKARFTRTGNRMLTEYIQEHNLPLNRCQKVVVASTPEEVAGLDELYRRGTTNGVDVSLIDTHQLKEIDPNVRTVEKALFSPTTSTTDPKAVCRHIMQELLQKGVTLRTGEGYLLRRGDGSIRTTKGEVLQAGRIINCAGLYADSIAKDFGFGTAFTIIPFKGIYLKYSGEHPPVRTNVYPVPNLKNPFLGVHYTVTVEGTVKIGPTAIPAFWRENYAGLSRFNLTECVSTCYQEAKLFALNSFNFRNLALEEMRKYKRSFFVGLAEKMTHSLDRSGFKHWSTPGIRAQLLDKRSGQLVQDFMVEGDDRSTHVLNAVSPAFTASFPFAEMVYSDYLKQ